MTQLVFVVAEGSTILGQSESREDGIGYLKETYGEEKFHPENYFPKCQGMLDEFCYDEGEKRFRLIEVKLESKMSLIMVGSAAVASAVLLHADDATPPEQQRLWTVSFLI